MRVDSLVWVRDARDPVAPTAAEINAGVRVELATVPPRPVPRVRPPHIHVTVGVCELKHCGWSGFHFHWRHRRYRSTRDALFLPAELKAFDEDCGLSYAGRGA